jgi:hypothetical protein
MIHLTRFELEGAIVGDSPRSTGEICGIQQLVLACTTTPLHHIVRILNSQLFVSRLER